MIGGRRALRIAISQRCNERAAEALDRDAGHDRGRDEQRRSAEQPRDDERNGWYFGRSGCQVTARRNVVSTMR